MTDYFIARQPIFDRSLDVYAYELLFRTSVSSGAPAEFDQDLATASVLSTSEDVGLVRLAGGHSAFINLPQRFLAEPDLLPESPEGVVLEILEDVELTPEVIAGISRLAERGYTLALDDFVYDPRFEPVLPHVDIVKLEIPRIVPERWEQEIRRLKDRGLCVLAEKVENAEDFERLAELGCDLFQGYFFARPRVVSGKRLVPNQLAMLELLSEINDPDTDIDMLSQLVSRDVALSLRAIRYVNSAANALCRRIESVQEAVVYLGRDTIKRWVTLLLMARVGDKPNELITMALTRARFMQLLAMETGRPDAEAHFTVGLFSLLDALMDMPMERVMESMSLPEELRDALQYRVGRKGDALSLTLALERGQLEEALREIWLEAPAPLAELHRQAINWADETLAGIAAG